MGILLIEGQPNKTDADSDAVSTFLPCESSTPRSSYFCRAGPSLPGPEEMTAAVNLIRSGARAQCVCSRQYALSRCRRDTSRPLAPIASVPVEAGSYYPPVTCRGLRCVLGSDRVAIVVLPGGWSSDTYYIKTGSRPANERACRILQGL